MTAREEGYLLLGSCLGNPDRKSLTTAQLRTLAQRAATMEKPVENRVLTAQDLTNLGYGQEMADRILKLLEERFLLQNYLRRGNQLGCVPITRVSSDYPVVLRRRLGLDSPGVLWAKGDISMLSRPAVSLVGSREIEKENAVFAASVGREAAQQGYVLISGNARGADRIAQMACLEAGGQVISVVADELSGKKENGNVLYLSEDGFDLPFSSLRALSRNRVIHALSEKTFVAQCALGMGGTWNGTIRNLKENWSAVFCFDDGSEAAYQLEQLGASLISCDRLRDLHNLVGKQTSLF